MSFRNENRYKSAKMRDKIVEVIEDILGEKYFKEDCKADSLVRIDDEECSCRGCIYGYSVRCMSPMIMEEEVKVFV